MNPISLATIAFVVAIVGHSLANLIFVEDKVLGFLEDHLINSHDADLSEIEPRYHLYIKAGEPLHSFEWNSPIGHEPPEVQRVLRAITKLVIVVHGFRECSDSKWMQSMSEVQTRRGAVVLLVDWRRGAQMTTALKGAHDYAQAARNVPLMGAALSQLMQRLISLYSIRPSRIEYIGFSLGAQIGGYFIKRLSDKGIKIARLVALDAAAPLFAKRGVMPCRDHVEFLEAVHTSSGDGSFTEEVEGMFGIEPNFGHVDFYPNGGRHQPGCKKEMFARCNHNRAHELYIEALQNDSKCRFEGVRCDRFQDAVNGECVKNIAMMEHDTPSFYLGMPARSCDSKQEPCVFYVRTSDEAPFCESSTGNQPLATNMI